MAQASFSADSMANHLSLPAKSKRANAIDMATVFQSRDPGQLVEVGVLLAAVLLILGLLLVGCSDKQHDLDFSSMLKSNASALKPATITKSEFRNGRLYIAGTCGAEGQILLVLPATRGDDRIIGSPKCKQGRYELITSTFGRPPCEVVVEYDSTHSTQSKVAGADVYCP